MLMAMQMEQELAKWDFQSITEKIKQNKTQTIEIIFKIKLKLIHHK